MAEQEWTPKMVEERLEEAAATLRRLPAVKVRGYVSSWPQVVRDFYEAYGAESARVRLGPPSPGAIDRMDETLTWLQWLERDDSRLVWARACGLPWKLLTWRFGVSRTTAWRRWVAALLTIAARLNGSSDIRTAGRM